MKRVLVIVLTGLISLSGQAPVFAQQIQDENQSGILFDDPPEIQGGAQGWVESEIAPSPIADRYTLGEGDRVFMNIFNLPDYTREYQVLADGTLNLPLIGTIYAKGKTLSQLAAEVEVAYARYIRVPAVTFDLQQARSYQIAVAGEVRRPGSYALSIDRQQQTDGATTPAVPTVTQVLQTAGGITESADIRNIRVYRPDPRNLSQGEWLDANLWQLIQAGDLSQDIRLRDGDSIVVPEATEQLTEEQLAIATANFSPDAINVYLAGQVQNPGLLELPPNTSLSQAVLAAGGLTASGARGVTLVRLNPNGTITEKHIRLDYGGDINDETNPALRNNDAILVGRSTLAQVTDFLNTALAPVGGFLNIFRVVDIIDGIDDNNDDTGSRNTSGNVDNTN